METTARSSPYAECSLIDPNVKPRLGQVLRPDLKRYWTSDDQWTLKNMLRTLFYQEEVWFILSLRIGQHVRHRNFPHKWLAAFILKPVTAIIHRIVSIVTGIKIDFDCQIDPGFYIGHAGRIIFDSRVKMGGGCNISSGVVLGATWFGGKIGAPFINHQVWIGLDAKVIGNVNVGHFAVILPNSIVSADVPDYAVVGGIYNNVSQVISYEGSFKYRKTYSLPPMGAPRGFLARWLIPDGYIPCPPPCKCGTQGNGELKNSRMDDYGDHVFCAREGCNEKAADIDTSNGNYICSRHWQEWMKIRYEGSLAD